MGDKDDDMEFGQQTQLEYGALDMFDYKDAPPSSPSPVLLQKHCAAPVRENKR